MKEFHQYQSDEIKTGGDKKKDDSFLREDISSDRPQGNIAQSKKLKKVKK
jgi:hypothetical protein